MGKFIELIEMIPINKVKRSAIKDKEDKSDWDKRTELKAYINVDHIQAVLDTGPYTQIYICDYCDPINIKESYAEVLKKLEDSEGLIVNTATIGEVCTKCPIDINEIASQLYKMERTRKL